MANTDPILTSESSVGRGQWNKGSLQVDGDFVLPESINEFTNPELRQEGKLRYDTTSNCPAYYNGTEWVKLDPKTLQEVTDEGNVTDNSIGIGTSAAPLAHLHIGNINSTRSSNPHLLLSETIDDASGSGNSHGFADSSVFSRTGTVSYAAFDGRFTLTGGTFNHIVSFQHNPLIDITGTVGNVYGLYTSTLLEAGNISNNYGVYAASPTIIGGSILNNFGIYIPVQSGATNNYGLYVEDTPSYLKGDLNLWKVSGSVGSGSILRFNSGTSGNGTPQAIITQELISSSRSNLVFKVRTASTSGDAGLTEVVRIDGGTVKTLGVTGKITASVAPTNPTDVVRKTELDLKANLASPIFTGITTAAQYKLSSLNTAPASSTDTGTIGEIRITSDYIYVCIATNTWVRSPLTTW